MTVMKNSPEIILSPDEEGRIRASVGSFIQGNLSETELLNLLRNLKTEKLAEIAKAETITPPDAQPSSLLKESAAADLQKSGIGTISARSEALESSQAASDAASRPASISAASIAPEASRFSDNNESCDIQPESEVVREEISSRPLRQQLNESQDEVSWNSAGEDEPRKSWSASELITGKLMTGVGAALLLGIGFILVAKNIHFSFGPAGKFLAMLVISLAAVFWGLWASEKSRRDNRDFSFADVFQVTVAGIGFTLLYVTISLGCFYFDLLPPWVWRPFLILWCLAMLWATAYRHHLFSLLAQIGILVSLPIVEECMNASLESGVLLALLAQLPFHVYGGFRKQPVVCYNSAVAFLLLSTQLAIVLDSDNILDPSGAIRFLSGDFAGTVIVLAAGVIVGFLALTGSSRSAFPQENTGFIRFCSAVNMLAFFGITIILTVITDKLFRNYLPVEMTILLAVYAGDYYFINRLRMSAGGFWGDRLISGLLYLWIIISLTVIPGMTLLALLLCGVHFIFGRVFRNREEYFPLALYLTVFGALHVCRDGLAFPDMVTPGVWKAVFSFIIVGSFIYALMLRNRTRGRFQVQRENREAGAPAVIRAENAMEFPEDSASAARYISSPAGLYYSRKCFTDPDAAAPLSYDNAAENNGASTADKTGEGALSVIESSGRHVFRGGLVLMLSVLLLAFITGNLNHLHRIVSGTPLVSELVFAAVILIAVIAVFLGIGRFFKSAPETDRGWGSEAPGAFGMRAGVYSGSGLLKAGYWHCGEIITALLALMILLCWGLGSLGLDPKTGVLRDALICSGGLLAGAFLFLKGINGCFSRKRNEIIPEMILFPGILYIVFLSLGFTAGYLFHPVASWPFYAVLFFAALFDITLMRLMSFVPGIMEQECLTPAESLTGTALREDVSWFRRGIHSFNIVLALLFYFNYADFPGLLAELGESYPAAIAVWLFYTALLGYFVFGDIVRAGIRRPGALSLGAVSLTIFLVMTTYSILRAGMVPVLILYPLSLSFYAVWRRTGAVFLRTLSLVLFALAVFFMYGFYYHELSPEVQRFFNTLHFIFISYSVQSLVPRENRSMRLLLLLVMLALPALSCVVLSVKTWEIFPMYWWGVLAAMILCGIWKRDMVYVPAGIALVYLYGYRDLSPLGAEIFNTAVILFFTLRVLFAAKMPVLLHAAATMFVLLAACIVSGDLTPGSSFGTGYPVFWALPLALYAVLALWNMKWNRIFAGLKSVWESAWGLDDNTVNQRRGIYVLAALVLVYSHYYHLMSELWQGIYNTLFIIAGNLLFVLWFRNRPWLLRSAVFILLIAAAALYYVMLKHDMPFLLDLALASGRKFVQRVIPGYPVFWWAVLAAYAVMTVVWRRALFALAGILLVYLIYYRDFPENWQHLYNIAAYLGFCFAAGWHSRGLKDQRLAFYWYFLPVLGATALFASLNLSADKPWLYLIPMVFSAVYGVIRRDYVMFAGSMLLLSFLSLSLIWNMPGWGGPGVMLITLTGFSLMSVVSFDYRGGRETVPAAVYIPAAVILAVLVLVIAVLSFDGSFDLSPVTDFGSLYLPRLPYFVITDLYAGMLVYFWMRSAWGGDESPEKAVHRASGSEGLSGAMHTAAAFVWPLFTRICLIAALMVSAGGLLAGLKTVLEGPAPALTLLLMFAGMGAALLLLTYIRFDVFSGKEGTLSEPAGSPEKKSHGFFSAVCPEDMPEAFSGAFLRKGLYLVSLEGLSILTFYALFSLKEQTLADQILASANSSLAQLEIQAAAALALILCYCQTLFLMFRRGNLRQLKIYYCMLKLFVLIYVLAVVFDLEDGVVLTVSWLFTAVLLLIFGFRCDAAAVRKTGLAACMLCILKLLIVDITYTGDITKALSYLLAGGILLGASFVYSYFSRSLSRSGEER
ncbi:DUF2339 domain-containing protein [Succinimonas sp.]|uniref:DUF2339 domain-containing protein n=1 Tax=Succinimonas sp. TaxID=1936151 RepID=UPI00386D5C30